MPSRNNPACGWSSSDLAVAPDDGIPVLSLAYADDQPDGTLPGLITVPREGDMLVHSTVAEYPDSITVCDNFCEFTTSG